MLEDPQCFAELFDCYLSDDEVVRLRTSNAMKRIAKADRQLVVPYVDRLTAEIAEIDQASAQWTLAQLFGMLAQEMTTKQIAAARAVMKRNLETHHDWIVLNATLDTLGKWAKKDEALKDWLVPHLNRLSEDERKSVAGRARKVKKWLQM